MTMTVAGGMCSMLSVCRMVVLPGRSFQGGAAVRRATGVMHMPGLVFLGQECRVDLELVVEVEAA